MLLRVKRILEKWKSVEPVFLFTVVLGCVDDEAQKRFFKPRLRLTRFSICAAHYEVVGCLTSLNRMILLQVFQFPGQSRVRHIDIDSSFRLHSRSNLVTILSHRVKEPQSLVPPLKGA